MKTYKAGELREDMLVVPVHMLEGFALVPVEQAKHAERYQWVRQADAAVIETLAWTADSADDFDRRVDEEISAPKGDSHE